MSEEKKSTPKKQKETKDKASKKSNDLDNELMQTFPASDPPSHSQPGRDRSKNDDR
ncbi:MAG: hypothetical protein JJU37_16525 [Balneolaceae bacterium]|nr:hypothetical protein [Balneolaceae bacterium]